MTMSLLLALCLVLNGVCGVEYMPLWRPHICKNFLVNGVTDGLFMDADVPTSSSIVSPLHSTRSFVLKSCGTQALSNAAQFRFLPSLSNFHTASAPVSLSFNVNLGRLGCGCVGAISAVDVASSYCDADMPNGQKCSEFDFMLANTRQFMVKTSFCSTTSSCSSCSVKFQTPGGAKVYGPGAGYLIDSSRAFNVYFTFFESATTAGKVGKISVRIAQDADSVVREITTATCPAAHLAGLTGVLTQGAISYTNYGLTAPWLDGDLGCASTTLCAKQSYSTAGMAFGGGGGATALEDDAAASTSTESTASVPLWAIGVIVAGAVVVVVLVILLVFYIKTRSAQGDGIWSRFSST